jgi:hypothetical protein
MQELIIPPLGKTPVMLITEFWNRVLLCFSCMEALTIDYVYGGKCVGNIIRNRVSGIPNEHMWMQAVTEKSIGMMIYLQDHHVSMPIKYFDTMIQHCADTNEQAILLFLTDPNINFYKTGMNKITNRMPPKLDVAMESGFTEIILITIWRFPKRKISLFSHPDISLGIAFSNGFKKVIHMLVPNLIIINHVEVLESAASKGHTDLVEYGFEHRNTMRIPELPNSVMIAAAKNGMLTTLKRLFHIKKSIPDCVFVAAFRKGFYKCVKWMLKYSKFSVSDIMMVEACKKGYYKLLKLVENRDFPIETAIASCKSGNINIVKMVASKTPQSAFNGHVLRTAANTGDSNLFIFVFNRGNFKTVKKEVCKILFIRGMVYAVKYLHQSGISVFYPNALEDSAKNCKIQSIYWLFKNFKNDLSADHIFNAINLVYASQGNPNSRKRCYTILIDKYEHAEERESKRQKIN